MLEEHFEAPSELAPVASLYEGREEDPVVVLDLAPEARWVAERYPNEGTEEHSGGHVQVRLRVSLPCLVGTDPPPGGTGGHGRVGSGGRSR